MDLSTKPMQLFIKKFDNLPIEVLLEIFGYLSVTDCFRAFSNLNRLISSALCLTDLSVDLTSVSNRTLKEFYHDKIFSEHSRQIRQLKMSNDLTFDQLEDIFHHWNFLNLKYLRSLTLIKPSYMTLGSLALMIRQFPQLEHLAIDSYAYPGHFFESITTKSSSIRSCFFPNLEIEDELETISSIERLTVTVENLNILFNLLTFYPRLKYLQVSIKSTIYIEDENPTSIDSIHCPNLETLKLRIAETSGIDFNEIVFCFDRLFVNQLESLSYHCATESLNHCDVEQWNSIFSSIGHPLKQFEYLLQIPYDSFLQNDVEHRVEQMQEKFQDSFQFTLSIDHYYFLIHSSIYPRAHLNLSYDSSDFRPLKSCDSMKYSRVRSLMINCSSIDDTTVLPSNITHLHLVGDNSHLSFDSYFFPLANQLHALKLNGFPDELPMMKELRQLTIQQVMFEISMIDRLTRRCPQLELLTIETNAIDQFRSIIDVLHQHSQLTELKFLRVFSRDPQRMWSDWLEENQTYIQSQTFTHYRARNLFLFVWF